MEKIIAGRHLDLEDAAKTHIIDELSKLEGQYRKLTSARVVVGLQRHLYTVEVILHGKNIDIEATASEKNIWAAIDEAIDKTERQLRRFIDKAQAHHSNRDRQIEVA